MAGGEGGGVWEGGEGCVCVVYSSLTSHPLTSHPLTSPHLTSPHLTSPHLTSPHTLTSPVSCTGRLPEAVGCRCGDRGCSTSTCLPGMAVAAPAGRGWQLQPLPAGDGSSSPCLPGMAVAAPACRGWQKQHLPAGDGSSSTCLPGMAVAAGLGVGTREWQDSPVEVAGCSSIRS